ncbi:Retinoblastoma-associated protein [Desmophyllum pertusum]|uniref:Retinoblastoma-associated protein n=1 Tax=Desmophyllum pertusum TaxID=174260 RepID=A0A9X0CVE2_9CNID|nr:Retinoblastoma-associated protein [Desmophyllum pertusum]
MNPPVSPAPKSSMRIPGKKNFYLSPLKNSPSVTLTPKSRSLYSFGESPGSGDRESLSRINASMRAAVHSQPKLPKRDCALMTVTLANPVHQSSPTATRRRRRLGHM